MRCAWLAVPVLLLAGIHPCLHALLAKRFPVAPGAVLVTGASSGIGLHAAVALSSEVLVFAGVRSAQDADRLKQSYPMLQPVVLDVTNMEQVHTARDEIAAVLDAKGLKLVGVVNNAGVSRHLIFEYEKLEVKLKSWQTTAKSLGKKEDAYGKMDNAFAAINEAEAYDLCGAHPGDFSVGKKRGCVWKDGHCMCENGGYYAKSSGKCWPPAPSTQSPTSAPQPPSPPGSGGPNIFDLMVSWFPGPHWMVGIMDLFLGCCVCAVFPCTRQQARRLLPPRRPRMLEHAHQAMLTHEGHDGHVEVVRQQCHLQNEPPEAV
ncbi:D-beta-hydroxybutyrate dehydrogenase, mitochondrial [Symbiodinium microadriaticum]|uniref:D-beta-hydroxybutyrate dehydrogenase, mitochondrial n=1 Tax=Symbiodinium microadriaticum TaxID=2951 RepID=A0A1Q9DWG6_SYMMI|nr:D-beta-hydroxybutyrate dehydrogenase, mitochondrial [Symbiodinium microadriaticum]